MISFMDLFEDKKKICFAIRMAFGPESLTTPMADLPAGVITAAMVSFS